jgi:hypothetical protein
MTVEESLDVIAEQLGAILAVLRRLADVLAPRSAVPCARCTHPAGEHWEQGSAGGCRPDGLARGCGCPGYLA